MKPVALSLLLWLVAASLSAAPPLSAAAEKLMKRGYALTGNAKGLYLYIPPRGDLAPQVGELARSLQLAKRDHQPVVVYSPDAQRATRATTLAFAMIRPNALRGVTFICAVGEKNDSYIRPVVEATGAKLYVEPLP
jgi:hypothetical protein